MPARKTSQTPLDPLSAAVGARVTWLRGERGMSSQELAHRAGMDYNYLWRIEQGRQNLSIRNVARLAKAFGVTLSELLETVDVSDVELDPRPYTKRKAAPEAGGGSAEADDGNA